MSFSPVLHPRQTPGGVGQTEKPLCIDEVQMTNTGNQTGKGKWHGLLRESTNLSMKSQRTTENLPTAPTLVSELPEALVPLQRTWVGGSANISPPKLFHVSISRHRKVSYLGESVLTALPLLTLFQRTRDAACRCLCQGLCVGMGELEYGRERTSACRNFPMSM